MFQGYVSGICCSDLSHEVEEVELHGTRSGDKIIRKLVLHNYKSISSIERGDCNLSLKHVTATSSCVCTCCDFVPATCLCYMSPQCALHKGVEGGGGVDSIWARECSGNFPWREIAWQRCIWQPPFFWRKIILVTSNGIKSSKEHERRGDEI